MGHLHICVPRDGAKLWSHCKEATCAVVRIMAKAFSPHDYVISAACSVLIPQSSPTMLSFLTADEWGYWYNGKPAKDPITDPYGKAFQQDRMLEHAYGRSAVHEREVEPVSHRLTRSAAGGCFSRPHQIRGILPMKLCQGGALS